MFDEIINIYNKVSCGLNFVETNMTQTSQQLYGYFKRQTYEISHVKTWTCLIRES